MNVQHQPLLPLGLGSILVDSLPTELLTDTAPSRYTVEAVFNRRIKEAESKSLLSEETLQALKEEGFPEVRLSVSDRRLNIQNTTLEQLRDGLASTLAMLLARISEDVERAQAADDLRLSDGLEEERRRLEKVNDLARSVVFAPTPREPDARAAKRSDREEIKNWVDEGGASGG
ncbi:MAG: hypothetical protein ACTH30_14690 [Leucobacter sp.]